MSGDVEFAMIERIARRTRPRADVLCGIGDDAAVLAVPAGQQLVVTMDTLVAGVHFPTETRPEDIGWKALAVNLSDLGAMAATPAWCMLGLTLPDSNHEWLESFLDGFFELADQQQVALIGGDTTRGPLSITVTAHGWVAAGAAVLRSGANVGDDIWVTGTLGDAAGGLAQWRAGGLRSPALQQRLDRPLPRVAVAAALRPLLSSLIDLSDGLLADFGHVLRASQVSAQVYLAQLPTSPALAAAFATPARWPLQVAGGDDYELCFTAAPEQRAAIARLLTEHDCAGGRIGSIQSGHGELTVFTPDGQPWQATVRGYQHFSEANS